MRISAINNIYQDSQNRKGPNFAAHLSVKPDAYTTVGSKGKFGRVMAKFGAWLETQYPKDSILYVQRITQTPQSVPILLPRRPGASESEVSSAYENLELTMDGKRVGFYFNDWHEEEDLLGYFQDAFNSIA